MTPDEIKQTLETLIADQVDGDITVRRVERVVVDYVIDHRTTDAAGGPLTQRVSVAEHAVGTDPYRLERAAAYAVRQLTWLHKHS